MRNSYGSYPVQLPVRYQTQHGDPIIGEGRTLAVSREALQFLCDRPLPRHAKIQIILTWPATLPDGTGLNLWILGTITECTGGCVEVRVGKYEFKTRRDPRSVQAAVDKNGVNSQSLTAGL